MNHLFPLSPIRFFLPLSDPRIPSGDLFFTSTSCGGPFPNSFFRTKQTHYVVKVDFFEPPSCKSALFWHGFLTKTTSVITYTPSFRSVLKVLQSRIPIFSICGELFLIFLLIAPFPLKSNFPPAPPPLFFPKVISKP